MSRESQSSSLQIEGLAGPSSFALVGELDLVTVASLEERFARALGDADLVFDLSRLAFVDVVGLHALHSIGVSLAERRRRLIIREPTHELRTMFAILGEERPLGFRLATSDVLGRALGPPSGGPSTAD